MLVKIYIELKLWLSLKIEKMKKNLKPLMLIGMALITVQGLLAQSIPTIEMTRNATVLPNSNYGQGASIVPVVTEFKNDAANSNVFTAYTPQSTFSVALANQQFTGFNYGTPNYNGTGVSTLQTTGLVFGIGPSLASDPIPQGGNPYLRYNIIGEYGGNGGPTNSMFTSNPTATGAQLGTGINVANAGFNSLNGAVEVFTTAQALYNNPAYPIGSRVYFGDLVLTFNQPVKNPVIHIAGLGGSYRYLPFGAPNTPANYVSTFFSTELELLTPGLTSTLMSSNQFMTVSGNNILNNNDVNPNGGSIVDPTEFISNLGAATGSIRINGTVQQLVYRVYLQGGTGSQFAWSAPGSTVSGPGAPRDPFTGDIWYVSASYDRPNLQIISGNVFIDTDGLNNNSISTTLTSVGPIANSTTNAGGTLFANLLNGANQVVASVPVGNNGAYLFDNVGVGTYTVQISTNQGVVGQPKPSTALPAKWVNTGEFNGVGDGNDGLVNGESAAIVVAAGDIKTNNNFGINTTTCPGPGENFLYVNNVIPQTGYYGGFALSPVINNFLTSGNNYMGTWENKTFLYAQTPLAAADYGIVGNASIFNNTFGSYNALGAVNSMMVVKPSANDQTVYYIIDSAGKNANNFQTYFKCGVAATFRGWLAKASADDAVVKIRVYDADVTTRVFADQTITLTGVAGNWTYFDIFAQIGYCATPLTSATKKIRFDIISVNGKPFSVDELCLLPPPQTLPISLSELTISKSACTANLVWKTSQESNSDRFEVEVSTGNNPVYTAAGTIPAAGYSNETKTYRFSYPMQEGVVYYFRIKMIDKDGSFTYSSIRSSSCTKGRGDIVIVPNPAKDKFTISGMENGKNSILIYAANGQLVKTQTSTLNNDKVDITYLAPGMYMVKVTSETGNTVVSKLIKY